jgi:hypothetical protein
MIDSLSLYVYSSHIDIHTNTRTHAHTHTHIYMVFLCREIYTTISETTFVAPDFY